MDENLRKITDEFVTERVNYYGANETDAVNEAFMDLRDKVERLRETLTDEQLLLLRAVENAYHIVDGETRRFFYEGGFSDAIRFLMGWFER